MQYGRCLLLLLYTDGGYYFIVCITTEILKVDVSLLTFVVILDTYVVTSRLLMLNNTTNYSNLTYNTILNDLLVRSDTYELQN